MEHTLNKEQKRALELINNGHNVFITGVAGTGKSYFIKCISRLPEFQKIVITATTGAAAVLLDCGASTFHSWCFRDIGDKNTDYYVNRILSDPVRKNIWLRTKIILIDEISMLKLETLEKFNDIARTIRNNNEPFGGIQLIISGDFLQLPSIINVTKDGDKKNGDNKDKRYCFQFYCFDKIFTTIEFIENFRQGEDKFYFEMLSRIRIGVCTEEDEEILLSKVQKFPDVIKDKLIKPTILFPKKFNVEKINEEELEKLPDKEFMWIHDHTIENEDKYQESKIKAMLDKFDKHSQHQPLLRLKVGAQVMLIKNLDVKSGLCNGAKGIVLSIDNNLPLVLFSNGIKKYILPEQWSAGKINNDVLYRLQIPLKLAWCSTIHKSQGTTLDSAYIDLGDDIFEYSQMYVALSRVRNLENLYLKNFNVNHLIVDPIVISWLESRKDSD